MKDSYAFYTDKLNEEYRPVFEQVEMYVMVQVVDEPTREERMSELLDSFLSAQEAGKSVQSVVGSDIERFCKTFVADFGLKNSLLSLLDSVKIFAWVFAVFSAMEIVLNLSAGRGVWTAQSTLDITGYFLALLVARVICWFVNRVLRQSMVRTKRVSMKTWRAVIFVVIQLVAEYALMLGLWGIVKSALPERRAWIAAKRAELK